MKADKTRSFNMDCLEFMQSVPDKFYDLAIVDPPYGIGMDNQNVRTKPNRPNSYKRKGQVNYKITEWDNKQPNKFYFDELFRISKNQIIWGANYFCNFIPSGFGWIYWDKQMGENNFSSGEFAYQSILTKSSFFSYPSMRVQKTRIHPTQKPVKLYEWLLINYAKQGDKILDTHGGSQSSRIACFNLGFEFDIIELDKDYFDAGNKRFDQHKKQLTLF